MASPTRKRAPPAAGRGGRVSGNWVRYSIGLIGAAIGFVIGKWDTLLDIFVGTSIAVTASADLDASNAGWQVRIRGLSNGTTQLESNIPLETAARGIAVSPGLYSVSLLQAEAILAAKTEAITRGTNLAVSFDRRALDEAWRQHQKIEVHLSVDRSRYAPGEPIGLQISATGLGYLWIMELDEKNTVTGTYPPLDQEGQNLIGPTRMIAFPNEKKEGFTAENTPGDYRLICLVTSSLSRTEADRIFNEIRGVSAKGFGSPVTNWGYATLAIRLSYWEAIDKPYSSSTLMIDENDAVTLIDASLQVADLQTTYD